MKTYTVITYAIALTSAIMAQASLVPLSMTGWDQDIIVEKTAISPASGSSAQILPPGGTGFGAPSSIGWVFYEYGAPNSSQGLPANGMFVSAANPSVTFQLQPYIGNNAIVNGGTLILGIPASFVSLSLLTSSQGAGGQSFQAKLNFSDGTHTVLNGNDPDWVTPPPTNTAIANIGVVHRYDSWTGFYAGALDLFEHDYILSAADQSKTLGSISFSRTSGNYEMLLGVSGEQQPAPSAPVFIVQPVSQVVCPGQPVNFTALAAGVPPPAYQWKINGTNIDGATGTNFTILFTTLTNVAYYSVAASNSMMVSTSAAVTLGLVSMGVKSYAEIYIHAPIGAVYRIDSTWDLVPVNWLPLTNVIMTTDLYSFVDYSTYLNSQRFFRVAAF